jgi:hypothetical protein
LGIDWHFPTAVSPCTLTCTILGHRILQLFHVDMMSPRVLPLTRKSPGIHSSDGQQKHYYHNWESIPCRLLSRQLGSNPEPVPLAFEAGVMSTAPLVLYYTSEGLKCDRKLDESKSFVSPSATYPLMKKIPLHSVRSCSATVWCDVYTKMIRAICMPTVLLFMFRAIAWARFIHRLGRAFLGVPSST